ncbi:MAG: hypothetical protein ACE5NP_13900, partial [Anaerolineae bacterium]
ANLCFSFDSRWVIDPLVNAVGRIARLLSDLLFNVFDLGVIDGFINGLGNRLVAAARSLRRLQSGYVRNYALSILVGVVLIVAFLILR